MASADPADGFASVLLRLLRQERRRAGSGSISSNLG